MTKQSTKTHQGPYGPNQRKDGSPAELRRPQVIGFALNALPLGAAAFRIAHVFVELAWRFGANEAKDVYVINYDEWERLTGLNPRAIRGGIVEAVESGLIELVERGAGRRPASYRLRPWTDWKSTRSASPSEAQLLTESGRSTSPSEAPALHHAKHYGSVALHHAKQSRFTMRSATDLTTSTTSTTSSTSNTSPCTVPLSADEDADESPITVIDNTRTAVMTDKELDRLVDNYGIEDLLDDEAEIENAALAEVVDDDETVPDDEPFEVGPTRLFAVGDRVHHEHYRDGTIREVHPGKPLVHVTFDRGPFDRGSFDRPVIRWVDTASLSGIAVAV